MTIPVPNLVDPALPGFTPSGFDAVIKKLRENLGYFRDKILEFLKAASAAAGSWLGSMFTAAAAKLKEVIAEILRYANEVLSVYTDLLKGLSAPLKMFNDGLEWQHIREAALEISAATEPVNINPELAWTGRAFSSTWTGIAADGYYSIIPYQSSAAFRVSALAGEASAAMLTVAAVGLAFYTSLLNLIVIAVDFVNTAVGAVSAINTIGALAAAQALLGKLKDLALSVSNFVSNTAQMVGQKAIAIAQMKAVTSANNNFPVALPDGQVDLLIGKWPDITRHPKWPKLIDGRIQTGQ